MAQSQELHIIDLSDPLESPDPIAACPATRDACAGLLHVFSGTTALLECMSQYCHYGNTGAEASIPPAEQL